MAITTIDGALAGMQYPREFIKAVTGALIAGRPHSLLYLAGMPGAGVAPTPGLKGAALTTYGGQLPFVNPYPGTPILRGFRGRQRRPVRFCYATDFGITAEWSLPQLAHK
jgi:hypothetical protein